MIPNRLTNFYSSPITRLSKIANITAGELIENLKKWITNQVHRGIEGKKKKKKVKLSKRERDECIGETPPDSATDA